MESSTVGDSLCCEKGDWITADGIRLFRRSWSSKQWPSEGAQPSRPVVVVVHGYGDHSGRYDELAVALVARGFQVVAYDARGHGNSEGRRAYVDHFDDYVRDLAKFLNWVKAQFPQAPLGLLGHSNGGLTALRAVQQGAVSVSALVLVSPLLRLQPKRKVVPDWLAKILSVALPRLPLPNGLKAKDLMKDAHWRARTEADPLCLKVATPRWYWQSTLAGCMALADARCVELPLLVVTGEEDSIVDPAGSVELMREIGSQDAKHINRPGELHEPLNESDRTQLFETLADWFEERLLDNCQVE